MTGNDEDLQQPRSEGGVVSLARGLKILELLAESEAGLSLSGISAQLGVNKSIATRLLGALEGCQYVFRNFDTGLYELTYRLPNLGMRRVASSRILKQSNGVIRRLSVRTGELARLAIVEPGQRLTWVLAHVGERRTLQIDPNYGLSLCLHTHAAAKAWLSTLSFDEAWSLMRREGLDARTPRTQTTKAAVARDLEQCRERGFALNLEENELGIVAVAAPIMQRQVDERIECVGAVSVGAPLQRVSYKEIAAMGPLCIQAAADLAAVWPVTSPAHIDVHPALEGARG